jgi:hypothetical protein
VLSLHRLRIQGLIFPDDNLHGYDMTAFSRQLATLSGLTRLELEECGLGEASNTHGATHFLQALQSLMRLEHISLASNDFGTVLLDGSLAAALRVLPLKTIDLSYNMRMPLYRDEVEAVREHFFSEFKNVKHFLQAFN